MIDNESLPMQDDVQNQGPTEDELLAAVMANSPIMEEAEPLPEEEEVPELDPEESEEVEEEDPTESEELVSEDDDEEVEEVEEEDAGEDDESTQDTDVYSQDDLDLEAQVMVKIDGEETAVSFGDLIKGYATEQHLSKQGRELGEARKELEAEREEKIGQLDQITEAAAQLLGSAEQGLAKQYSDLEEKIESARKDGDTYELSELKDKREQVQKQYWNARRKREGLMEAVQKQREEVQAKQWNEQLEYFNENISTYIPDFDEKVALEIRDFAVSEGLSEEVLASIVDPVAVKMLDEYRRLKQNVKKGTAKRKNVPAKKAVPSKKAKPAAKKKQDAEAMVKARAFREDASQEDQMEFLKSFASKSLNL